METYEVVWIDAWNDGEGWYWNDQRSLGTFKTKAKNINRAFLRYLRKTGRTFQKGKTRIESYDGTILEVQDRKTGEPLYAAKYVYECEC